MKKVQLTILLGLVLMFAVVGTVVFAAPNTFNSLTSYLKGTLSQPSKKQIASGQENGKSGAVLAAHDEADATAFETDVRFEVNIPAVFNDTVTFTGESVFTDLTTDTLVVTSELTAPNVLYSLIAETDSGLEITGDQELTIVNTDKGSSQNIFKNFKLGSTTISAGSNTDTFEFVEGTNIDLSLDTSNKKLTITNSYTAPAQPWTQTGTNVHLTTSTDSVGIGTTTPAYKLQVVGTSNFSGNASFDGDVTLGDESSDTVTVTGGISSGSTIRPLVDLGADLGTSSYRFNNIYVANINSNAGLSTAGQAIFTYEPTSAAYTQSSILINPTSPFADGYLLGIGVAGYQRAGIDEDGDLSIGYNDAISAPTSDYPLNIYGHNGTRVSYIDTSGNAYFAGSLSVGSLAGGFTQGSVIFQGASNLSQDNSNFFWDNTTKRLGLGTTSPATLLDVNGVATFRPTAAIATIQTNSTDARLDFITDRTTPTNSAFRFRDAAGNASLDILDNGNVGIGTTSPTSILHATGSYGSNALAIFNQTNSGDLLTASASGVTKFRVTNSGEIIAPEINKVIYVDGNTYAQTCAGINAAIDALGSAGGEIYLPEGTYTCAETITIDANETTIRGAGKGTIISAAAAASWSGGVASHIINLNGMDYLTFSDFQVDATNLTGQTSDIINGTGVIYSTFQDLYLANSDDDGIELVGSSNNIIKDIVSTGHDDNGLLLTNVSNYNVVSNSEFSSNAGHGISLSTTSTANLQNRFVGNYVNITSSNNGIQLANCDRCAVTGNTFYNVTATSSVESLFIQGSDYTTVSGNSFYQNSSNSTSISIQSGADYTLVTGNTFATHDTTGIAVSSNYNTITGNTLDDDGTADQGINIAGDNNVISSNTFTDFTKGNGRGVIFSSTADSNVAANNIFNNNTFDITNNGTNNQITNTKAGELNIGTTDTPTHMFSVMGATTGKALMMLNQTGDQNIFTASASGTARFTLNNTGGAILNSDTNGDAGLYLREANTLKWSVINNGDNSDSFDITDAEGDQGVTLAQGATSWAAASDITLKENINLVEGSLDKVKALRGVYYNFIGNSRTEVGLIAQEVQAVLPELVVTNKNGKLAVMYDRLAPVLVNAINDQQVQIDKLGNVTGIEDRLAAAETNIEENTSAIGQLQTTLANLFKTATTFLADVTFKGKVWLSPDQTGSVTIPAGSTAVKVTFKNELPTTPLVHATPQRALDKGFSVTEVSGTSFTIELPQTEAQDTMFTWLATLKDSDNPDQPTIEVINPGSSPAPATPEPTSTPTPSPSSEPAVSGVATESGGTP